MFRKRCARAMSSINNLQNNIKSGFVAIIGKPNVGKSTILNWFLREKISIVSSRPETTRDNIKGILTEEGFQIVFIDTPGAYPGIGAEERGQSHAIAVNLREMASIATPIMAIVIGEGGSGGALGVGVADRVAVLENSYYSVISPEGCAAILWKDGAKAPQAAQVLKLTGEDLLKMHIIDEVISEPLGGAHRDAQKIALNIKEAILRNLKELELLDKEELLKLRYKKFRSIGITA